ncbi:MAG TPA: lysine exporter LysO family protein [Exilispira sp.]|nr:lysine exporter LysO family protein [Exilispira sp.]
MLILLIFLFFGIILGYILKEKKTIIFLISKFLQITIYLLLFVMGYKLAIKKEIFLTEKSLFFKSVLSAIILFLFFLLYSYVKSFIIKLTKNKNLIKSCNKIEKFYDKNDENNKNDNNNKNNNNNNNNKYNKDIRSDKFNNIIKDDKDNINIGIKDAKDIKEEKNSFSFHEIIVVAINIGFIFLGFIFYFILNKFFFIRLEEIVINSISEKVLYALLLFVGMDLGRNFLILKKQKLKINSIFLPVESIAITFISSFFFSFVFGKKLIDGMIIYGGLGWYSLSSVLLSVKGLTTLSIYSFIHNVFREVIAIISSPIVARLDPNLPILIGGATSMDVMLPFVQKYSGHIFTLASFYSGMICSLSVSFIINSLMAFVK